MGNAATNRPDTASIVFVPWSWSVECVGPLPTMMHDDQRDEAWHHRVLVTVSSVARSTSVAGFFLIHARK